MDHSQLPRVHLKLIFVFFSLFLFFQLNFVGGQVKTEKVVVPTDSIVDSPAKLLATTKTLILARGSLEMLKGAPEGSLLQKLSSKPLKVVTYNDLQRLGEIRTHLDDYVPIGNDLGLVYWIIFFSYHAQDIGLVAFYKKTPYYETLSSFKMKRSLIEEHKRFINKA